MRTMAWFAVAWLTLAVILTGCSAPSRVIELPKPPPGAVVAPSCPVIGELDAWQLAHPAGSLDGARPVRTVIACDAFGATALVKRVTTDAAMVDALNLPSVRHDPPLESQRPPVVCPAVGRRIDSVVFLASYESGETVHVAAPTAECGAREEVATAYDRVHWVEQN